MFLLDTMTLSEPRRPRPAPDVVRFLETTPDAQLYTSAVVIGELWFGALVPSDAAYRTRLIGWLSNELLPHFGGRVLPVTSGIAAEWARVRADAQRIGQTVPTIDALIAATAIVHDLTVVTRNEVDFRRSGARVLNPWTG